MRKNKFEIGHYTGEQADFKSGPAFINLDKLLAGRLLLTGNSGSGKSTALRQIMETLYESKIPQIIIDPEGEFSTLRSRFDRYIVAGKNADVPIDCRTAGMFARKLMELNASAIIDLYEIKHEDKHNYVKLFLDALIDAPKNLWGPRIIFIDEVHIFCPEAGSGKSVAHGSIIELESRGRKRGLGSVLATQRLSKLDKDAAAECQSKLIGLANMDIDRERAAKELGFSHKEDIIKLRDLSVGQFYAVGPAFDRGVNLVQINKAITEPVKIGSQRSYIAPSGQIKKVLEKLKDIPKEVDQEMKTIADHISKINILQSEIRKLSSELIHRPRVEVIKEATEKPVSKQRIASIQRKIHDHYVRQVNLMVGNYESAMFVKFTDIFAQTNKQFKALLGELKVKRLEEPKIEVDVDKVQQPPVVSYTPVAGTTLREAINSMKDRTVPNVKVEFDKSDVQSEFKLNDAKKKILISLALFPGKIFSVKQVALMCGMASNGNFSNYITELVNAGLATRELGKGMVQITDYPKAISLLGNEFRPPEKSYKDYWLERYTGTRRKIFEILLDNPDRRFRVAELAELVGVQNNGNFSNYCGDIAGMNLAQRGKGLIWLDKTILELGH